MCYVYLKSFGWAPLIAMGDECVNSVPKFCFVVGSLSPGIFAPWLIRLLALSPPYLGRLTLVEYR